jgi:2-keto-4-pentenoate hydratase
MTEKYLSAVSNICNSRTSVQPMEPISLLYPEFEIDDAYQIQKLINQKRVEGGGRIVGYKVGLTSDAVQQQLGVDQPDFGTLFADMELINGQSVNANSLIAPKAEGEIGFCFKQDLNSPNLTILEMLSAIDFFFPVVEIVDSVVKDWNIGIVDTIADNASSALYMTSLRTFSTKGVDFASLSVEIDMHGKCVAKGKGSACLGNPLLSTYWLVRKLISLGTPICKGQIVLSGALAPMIDLVSGVELKFKFNGLDEITLKSE